MTEKFYALLLVFSFFIATLSAAPIADEKCLTCNAPQNLRVIPNVDGKSAHTYWSQSDSQRYYHVQYKLETDTTWKEGALEEDVAYYYPTFQVLQYNLQPCSKYRVRIAARCKSGGFGDFGDWKVSDIFSTLGCPGVDYGCAKPKTISAQSYNDSVEKITWTIDTNLNTAQYVLNIISDDGTFNKTFSDFMGNNFLKSIYVNLSICKNYTAILKLQCGTQFSDSISQKFQTTGCSVNNGICTPPPVVHIGGNFNDSLKIYWTGTAKKYYVEYRDSTTQTWTHDSTTNTFAYLTHLKKCFPYDVRVKAVCSPDISDPSLITHFFTYTDNCYTATDYCPLPEFSEYNTIRDTADMYINTIITQTSYLVFQPIYFTKFTVAYRPISDTSEAGWIRDTINNRNSSYKFHGLKTCLSYILVVRTLCGNNFGTQERSLNFKVACVQPCPQISDLKATSTGDSTTISWETSMLSNALLGYQIQYRAAASTDTSWSKTIFTRETNLSLKNLTPCAAYTVRVNIICEDPNFDIEGLLFSPWQTINFKAGANCLRGDHSGMRFNSSMAVRIKTNPDSDNPIVIFKLEQPTPIQFDILNINGSLIAHWDAGILPIGDYEHTFNTWENNLPTGVYIILLRTDNGIEKVLKWVRE